VRLFRLNSAEILRRNSGRTGGFEEGKFEADSAIKEVTTQICLSRANAIQFRSISITAPPGHFTGAHASRLTLRTKLWRVFKPIRS
jgi:hypothetical protein